MKQQTAVEWFANAVQQHIVTFGALQPKVLIAFKELAKAMEREQIMDAYDTGNRKGYDEHILSAIHDLDEQYYEQTYGGEGDAQVFFTEEDMIRCWNASRDYTIVIREPDGIGRGLSRPNREDFIQSLKTQKR